MVCCHWRMESTEPSALPSVVITNVGHWMRGRSAVMSALGIFFTKQSWVDTGVRAIILIHHSVPSGEKFLPRRPLMVRRAHGSMPFSEMSLVSDSTRAAVS